MFKRSNSSTVNQSNSSVDVKSSVNNNKPNNGLLSMKLGDNNLVFKDGDWVLDSSDLDLATFEIEKLIDEKEILVKSLSDALDQVEELKKEVVEVNDTKSVILGMLMDERQQRIQAEQVADGYKEELRETYRVIVELRKLIPKQK